MNKIINNNLINNIINNNNNNNINYNINIIINNLNNIIKSIIISNKKSRLTVVSSWRSRFCFGLVVMSRKDGVSLFLLDFAEALCPVEKLEIQGSGISQQVAIGTPVNGWTGDL